MCVSMCGTTYSYVWVCVTSLIHMCENWKPEIPILYKLRFAGLFLEEEIYTQNPRDDPLKSLDHI